MKRGMFRTSPVRLVAPVAEIVGGGVGDAGDGHQSADRGRQGTLGDWRGAARRGEGVSLPGMAAGEGEGLVEQRDRQR